MTAVPHTFKSSELSRNSAEVFRAADLEGRVEITRRDGESLILSRKSSYAGNARGIEVASDLIAASLDEPGRPFVDRLQERFPWMSFLSSSGREQFAAEMVASARAGASVRDFTSFLRDLYEWRETAAGRAAGYTPNVDLEWLDESVEVMDPRTA
ncbi:type II toxin-antitoxin system Phd/YefM family antitoxin [Citricoccus sp. NPDC079358]|uniref:type II toxin-antitoxin system Phd/YefM family antitoxin n=1 Tax=Citricoccus sp. NPDC079358 TaxID=3154653 RepID=UPI00344BA581